MSEFTQIKLGSILGIWKYENRQVYKYYKIYPLENKFIINWGKTLKELNDNFFIYRPTIVISSSAEAYRRILSKARGGFKLEIPIEEIDWTPQCSDEFDSIEEIIKLEEIEFNNLKPRKKTLSLIEWINNLKKISKNENFENIP